MKKLILFMVLFFFSSLAFASATNFLTNLEFYLECEDNAGDTTVTDSHRDYTFTMSVNTNTVTSAGFYNNGFNLAQTEYFNRVTSDFSSNTTGTSCYFKYGNGGGGGSYIHSYYQDPTHGYNQNIADPNMNILYRVNGATIIKNGNTVGGGSAGWDYFCMVHNLTHLAFFVNGTLVESVESYSWINATSGNAEVVYGEYPNSHDGGFAGIMDEIGFWSKAFTPQEIMELFTIYTDGGGYAEFGSSSSAGGVEINATFPQNGTVYGIVNMSDRANNIYYNISINDTSASCVINDTDYSLVTGAVGDTVWSWLNNTLQDTGTYYLNAHCNRTNTTINGTEYIYFEVDLVSPVITVPTQLSSNSTNVYNGSLVTQINFTDNREIWSIGIQFLNGTDIYNATNLGTEFIYYNISQDINGDCGGGLFTRLCDAHTKKSITPIDRIDIDKGIKYVIQDNPLWVKDGYIHIYPVKSMDYTTPQTAFSQDRYVFTFNKVNDAEEYETFIIESTEKLEIAKKQIFKGHVVVPNLGANGYWIDFENDDVDRVELIRKSDKKIEVRVYNLKGNSFSFNSLGELNCVTATYYFGNVNPQQFYSSRILNGSSTTFNLNIDENPVTVASSSAILYYNGTPYSDATSNFSQTVTAPSNILGNDTNVTWNWLLTINGYDYNLSLLGQNVSNFYMDNCTIYPYNALNFTVVDGNTTDPIGNYNFEGLINYYPVGDSSNSKDVSLSTTGHINNNSLCMYPDWANLTGGTTIQFTATGYDSTNFNKYLWLFNQSTYEHTVYMVGSDISTPITTTVVDENDYPLVGYVVEAYKYILSTNSYLFIDSKNTGSTGDAVFNLDVRTDEYRFLVYDSTGTLVYTEPKQILSDTTYVFRVIIGVTKPLIEMRVFNLPIDINGYKNNKTFVMSWEDISLHATQVSMRVKRFNSTDSVLLSYENSSAVTGGQFTYVITDTTTNLTASYIAEALVISNLDNESYLFRSATIDYRKDWEIFGDEALFMAFLFIGTLAFIGLAISAEMGIAISILSMVVAFALGWIEIALGGLVGVIICFLAIMAKVNR